MADVRLQLLGRFRVYRDGQEVPPAAFGGRKVRTLLRLLAVRRPDLVAHDALTEALWVDGPPTDPVGNLNVLVNRARRALDAPGVVVTGPGGYALGECVVDVEEFLAAAVRARRLAAAGEPAGTLRAATAALRLWGEPLAEDVDADWARATRERLLRVRVETLETAARAALALGDPGTAAAQAADAVAAAPLREPAVLLLAQALAAAGDRAAALARLAALRRQLVDELGVDPGPEVEALQLRLLRGEAPTRPPPTAPAAPTAPTGFAGLPFVGRAAQVARLRAVLAERGVVAVGGQAGVGKSRLLAEALRAVHLPVIATRAVLPERAEAWGLARSLLRAALEVDPRLAAVLPARARDALAGLLPELADGPAMVLDGQSRHALLLAGGLRLFEAAAAAGGAVLVVDDLQWADPSSLTLLGAVLARVTGLAGVLAYRCDELPPAVLAELRGARAVTDIALGPLTGSAVAELVGDPPLAAALSEATDATPFALTEVIRELLARDALIPAPDGWHPAGPQTVSLAIELGQQGRRQAVRRRAERHPDGAEALALAALLARPTPARTIAAAAGRPEPAVLTVLAELAAAGLVRLGERGWACTHDLVGETVVADLAPAERGRLHGLLARALQAEDADPSEIARHHREAGDADAAAAAYLTAARRALHGHATREAGTLADAALVLAPRPVVRAQLLDLRAEARAAHGDLAGALADLHDALAADAPGDARARRLARLAMLTSGAQDPRRAADLAELALVAARHDAARALALETAAILDMNLGRPQRAAQRAEAALGLYRDLDDAPGVARILDGRAMAVFLDGHITTALALFARAAQLFTDSGELLRAITPRSTRGHALVMAARGAEGLAETTAALHLARELDAPEGQAYALWHRSEALSALGRAAEAETDARQALAIARALDHRGWTTTAHRALGIALQAQGRHPAAAAEFAAAAQTAGEDLALFASWAAARGALAAIATSDLAAAEPLIARALALGPPLGHFEARLAAVELAAARGDPDCAELAARALRAARDAGHHAFLPRLAQLARRERPLDSRGGQPARQDLAPQVEGQRPGQLR